VQIVVDNGSTLVPLRDFTDFSDGWEQAQIDLTPYVGQVITWFGNTRCFRSTLLSIQAGW